MECTDWGRWAKNPKLLGVGDQVVPAYIGEVKYKVKPFKGIFTAPVAFAESNDVLIGQEGFFDVFQITFEKGVGVFELTLPITRPAGRRKKFASRKPSPKQTVSGGYNSP